MISHWFHQIFGSLFSWNLRRFSVCSDREGCTAGRGMPPVRGMTRRQQRGMKDGSKRRIDTASCRLFLAQKAVDVVVDVAVMVVVVIVAAVELLVRTVIGGAVVAVAVAVPMAVVEEADVDVVAVAVVAVVVLVRVSGRW